MVTTDHHWPVVGKVGKKEEELLWNYYHCGAVSSQWEQQKIIVILSHRGVSPVSQAEATGGSIFWQDNELFA